MFVPLSLLNGAKILTIAPEKLEVKISFLNSEYAKGIPNTKLVNPTKKIWESAGA